MKNVSKCYYYTSLLIWIVILQAVGATIGFTTNSGKDGWYEYLNRSPANPPGVVFSIVWPVLYLLIAISGWILQFSSKRPRLTIIRVLFGIQLALNWSWSYLFFTFHLTALSFAEILLIVAINATIIGLSFRNIRWISLLLLPYLLWTCFASYLNGYIVVENWAWKMISIWLWLITQ